MKIKDNLERSWRKIQTRSGLALIITAALLLQVSGIVQYMFARNGIKEEVRLRARTELELKNNEIARVVEGVENVVDNLRPLLEWSIMTPDSIYSILEFIIRQNPSISGCAIAFEPDYFADKGRWYEPFAGRHGEIIVHDQIGGPEHDYLNTKWYRDGLLSTSGCWAEPYLDDAGSQT